MTSSPPPRPDPNQAWLSPQSLLQRILALRARIDGGLRRASQLPPEYLKPPPPVDPADLLRQAVALHKGLAQARASADKLASAEAHAELLAEVAELRAEVDAALARHERAAAAGTREELLHELLALRSTVATALARVRLIPGVVVG